MPEGDYRNDVVGGGIRFCPQIQTQRSFVIDFILIWHGSSFPRLLHFMKHGKNR
jgi:hypothetical protein